MKFPNFFSNFGGNFLPFCILVLSKMGNFRDERNKKKPEHHACLVMPPLAAKFVISVLSKNGEL